MKGCNIEIALKARPRMSLLAAAVVTLSGAFFSAQAQEPIKIGFGVSLTGGLASSGKAHLMSKQIWAEEINAKGGLLGRPIKLVYYDDQTNAATVPGIYAKLIDVDKVDLLMGHATNLIVAAMPLIIERKKAGHGASRAGLERGVQVSALFPERSLRSRFQRRTVKQLLRGR
jgi:hypothetical protein